MKKYISAAALFLFIMILVSCEKSASTSIEGKWNVISDSVISSGVTISYTVYKGTSGDYFLFNNGVLSTKESSQLDTFSYQLISNDTIQLALSGALIYSVPETGPYTFKGNEVRIDLSPVSNNPGYSYERIITLER